jgi:DNA ligase-1
MQKNAVVLSGLTMVGRVLGHITIVQETKVEWIGKMPLAQPLNRVVFIGLRRIRVMLNKINDIAQAKGNDKIKVLKKYPELKQVLLYAYDPSRKYYMTASESYDYNSIPDEPLNMSYYFEILDKLSGRILSGGTAVTELSYIIRNLPPDDAEVFKRILNKDLRCGINLATIEAAWPGLIPKMKPSCMLLKTYKPEKVKFPCLAAVKKDGVRGRWLISRMATRQGKPIIGIDHITDELNKYSIEFDGELCVPNTDFDTASGLIRSLNPTPEAVYYIFDSPSLGGTKQNRYSALISLFKETQYIKLIPHYLITNQDKLYYYYNESIKHGEEGIVIYDPDSLYEDKRSYDWMRMVPIKTADCVVIGFFEGKGKHANRLGGIIVDFEGHEVRVGTGFSDEQREDIWMDKSTYDGVIAELEFKEKTKAGSLRQPRFKTFRWDK